MCISIYARKPVLYLQTSKLSASGTEIRSKQRSKENYIQYKESGKYKEDLKAMRIQYSLSLGERECQKCNASYYLHIQGTKLYCSEGCSKQAAKDYHRQTKRYRSKAKLYGGLFEPIDIFKVFDRDKWKCCNCGVKTPKRLRGTIEANAPELDHIIPMSKGGGHIYENVQLLCRKCNGLKSDKQCGQLILNIDKALIPRGVGRKSKAAL